MIEREIFTVLLTLRFRGQVGRGVRNGILAGCGPRNTKIRKEKWDEQQSIEVGDFRSHPKESLFLSLRACVHLPASESTKRMNFFLQTTKVTGKPVALSIIS